MISTIKFNPNYSLIYPMLSQIKQYIMANDEVRIMRIAR